MNCSDEEFEVVMRECSLKMLVHACNQQISDYSKWLFKSPFGSYGAPLHSSERIYLSADRWLILDQSPLFLCNAGPLVELFIRSGAAEYVRFEPISRIILYWLDTKTKYSVPMSKEAVMLDRKLTLAQKHAFVKSMRTGSVASLDSELVEMLTMALLGKTSSSIKDLEVELGTFVQGLGRFIPRDDRCATLPSNLPAPFLIPCHGSSDLVQGLARVLALKGASFAFDQSLSECPVDGPNFISICVVVTDMPLDQGGCLLYRMKYSDGSCISLLQTDEAAFAATPGLTIYHAWPVFDQSVLNGLFYFTDSPDPDDGCKPKVLWSQTFKLADDPITSMQSELRLFSNKDVNG